VRRDRVGHQAQVLLHLGIGELAADQALHRVEGVLRVGDGLALGRRAHQHFAVLREGDDRRRGAVAFAVLDDAALPPSMIATQELVVPRSMPMILPMVPVLDAAIRRARHGDGAWSKRIQGAIPLYLARTGQDGASSAAPRMAAVASTTGITRS
jgi:hypothetical protein